MKKLLLLILIIQSIFAFAQDNISPRSRESFNSDWKFKRFGAHPETPDKYIDEPKGLETSAYNDKNWRNLNLPHDWGIEGPFRNDLNNSTGLLP